MSSSYLQFCFSFKTFNRADVKTALHVVFYSTSFRWKRRREGWLRMSSLFFLVSVFLIPKFLLGGRGDEKDGGQSDEGGAGAAQSGTFSCSCSTGSAGCQTF